MNSKTPVALNQANAISTLFERSELESALNGFETVPEYDAALRYYEGAVEASSPQARLTPVSLLKETLESISPRGSSTALQTVQDKLADYLRRLNTTVELLSAAKPVPKKLHFVWVGGALFGDNQRDYFNIWKQVLSKDGYTLNLWYDPDALMAFDTNRIITQAAKAHAMETGGAELTRLKDLFELVERRVVVLRQQMFEHVKAVQQRGGKGDDARIDLLVNAYGQDRVTLEAARARYLESHLAMAGEHVRVRDARAAFSSHFLWDVYEREVSFRGNLAAASDVVRLQAQSLEGGTYSDLDYLPPLVEELGGVDISKYSFGQKLGVLQLLLNGNPALMPKRDKNRYKSHVESVPVEDREALVKFSESSPDVLDIFAATKGLTVPQEGVRLGTALGNKEMNAFIMAHPESGMVDSIMKRIRSNYDLLLDVEQKIIETGAHWDSDLAGQFAQEILQRESELTHRPLDYRDPNIPKLFNAIGNYHRDGIYPQAAGTILLTGPGAAIWGMDDFMQANCAPDTMAQLKDQLKLDTGYNRATEEETISGWVDNVTEHEEWVSKEQQSWRDGKYKARYTGNLAELLKGQTLTFKQGWPVIEGKPVLLTDVLQRLLDEQGERFIRAMNDKLSGEVTLDKPLSISFAERQQILAQTVSELPKSDGAQSVGNLNEMFSRIEHGSLPLNQLSPLQRVVLGGLFGAHTLDEQGFGEAWKATRALASNTAERGLAARYEAIEQTLLKQKNTRFEAGFKKPSTFHGDVPSAQVLKVLAFAEPMSVRQWGEHVARIRFQAEYELRHLIFERSATVLETFIAKGASSGRLMPQGLLVRGEGDPGRRCYPLVLAMAAALEKGPSAVDALSGRLANANLSPDANETHAFLTTLDELRTVPMARSGILLGASRLDQVMHALETRTSTCTLMLNTESHSLLVAKIVNGGASAYRFYDPNFGVFGFEQAQDLNRALEQFLSSPELAKLYDISHLMDATFNVVDLNGPAIADQPLPSHNNVSGLLSHDPISPGVTVTPWEHHAALRARSLSENARLGRGLNELDARYWAGQIQNSAARLHAENNLGRDFAPVFDSVREMPGGQYEISLVNLKDPARTVRVSSTDSVLSRIRSYLTETFQTLSVKPSVPGKVDPTDVSAVHTLNAAFTVQALLMALKSHEQVSDINEDRSLTTAVQMHGYLSYAQLAHGNLLDVVELVKLFRVALSDAPLVARTTSSVVVNALGHIARDGLATVLQLATLGFDIYLLANAKDDLQQAQYGTQLAFDSTGLALSVAGVGAGLAGASTAAAFLGGAGVILGGLAIGVSALVEGFNGTLERGRRIGQYLNRVDNAYRSGGHSVREGVFYPNPYAVIREIDLRNKQLTFDSQEIFSANTSALHPPEPNIDRSKAINIRQHFGLSEHATITDPTTFQALVLPCVAKTWFGFNYSALPFSTTRSEHFETALKLEYDAAGGRQFWFTFYKFPSEYILHNLYPVEVETTINILLDEEPRSLLVPELPKILRGKLSYSIEGLGGHCALTLNPGVRSVSLSQAQKSRPMAWTLHALWLSEEDIDVGEGQLKLGAVDVQVMGTPELIVQTSHNSFRVDWTERQVLLEELEADPSVDTATIQARVRKLARTNRLASPFTAVQNFPVPFADPQEPQLTTAFYEQARDRFIYARDLPPALANQARLGAVMGEQAYFYCSREALIWRSDVVTGQVHRFYRLMDPVPGSSISVFQDLGHGVIRIVQQVTQRTGREAEVIYLLGEEEVKLIAIACHLTERQHNLLLKDVMKGWSNFFWDYELLVKDSKLWPLTQVKVVDYKPAAFVSITPLTEGKKDPVSTWVRDADGLVIRPDMSQTEGPGGPVSPLLLTPTTSAGDVFLFYDKHNHTLYRQNIGPAVTGVDAQAERIDLYNVIEVVANEGRYVALTREGLYFDIDDQGRSQLAAITEDWLEDARGPLGIGFEWWTEVEAVAREYQALSFAILGLGNGRGGAKLCAWYTDHRWLMADFGPEKVVRLVATTPNDQAGWLLDVSAGQLYRQAFFEPEKLQILFENGQQLLRQDLLPAPQKVWSQWSFAHVWAHETGLRGRTLEGVELEMRFGEPARIVGVTGDWVLAKQGTNDPYDAGVRHALKALVSEHPHEAFISVGGHSGYQWYVVDIDQVVGEVNTGLETRLLGVRQKKTALLHEVPSQVTYSASRDVWLESSVARREGEVLSLEFQGELKDLMPLIPDGVSQLVLSYGSSAISCCLSSAVWQQLECIVVDGRRSMMPGTLIVETGAQDTWWVSRVEGQLLLTDPATGHTLIMRDQFADSNSYNPVTLRLQVHGATMTVTQDDLVQALAIEDEDNQLAALMTKMAVTEPLTP
ncbi:TcdA/TcdB pore-forming domain-containing protein [Pseudomonas sp. P9_31]|uniref:TcdA/TcdB pore-forming domain-containing protein n=1 Tax=Pseudomonas sp. P9_31 TaxID=3043448 RepID=UPI002A35EC8B|nr:TcdA/TcdB pore-forming domain-containing protein [Pseudomonas sp. P9_31]WPN57389.1 TcdA/TcdB pore-forming domain-containing protein [Pseudomonas sp. P9_31]